MTSEADIAARWGVTFSHHDVGAVTLRVASAGSGPLIILVHGFPECWYSWRHQIAALAAAGYQVVAPDVRGYGGSDKPFAVSAYDMQSLTGDMVTLARLLSPDSPSIIVGHDWGAPIAWNSALLYPEVFNAVAGLSVPHVPPGETVAIDLFRQVFTDRGKFFYMVYFQEEGIAEAELEADPERSIRLFYTAIAGDAASGAWPMTKAHGKKLFDDVLDTEMPRLWFSEDDLRYYTALFKQHGFRGPLNRYRNFHRDSEFLQARGLTMIEQPSLYITGERDMVSLMYPSGPVEAMKKYVSHRHTVFTLAECGHWTQQEKPQEVNSLLIDWLSEVAVH